jgi:pimeloyl-ACP methyl ester carboxylesterase
MAGHTRPKAASMSEDRWLTVTTADSRALEVLVEGPSDGFPLLYHAGTPSGAVSFPRLTQAAAATGLRTVTYSRPGYGTSTPQPGRTVADVAADVVAVLAALGLERFVTLGWSGGGPHALACAALLPDACRSAATLAGAGPYGDPGVADWLDGMGADNVAEFSAAVEGEAALTDYLAPQCESMAQVTGAQIADALGDLVPEVDRRALTGDIADYVAESCRRAVLQGVAGWRDDDLAFVRPWGFTVGTITVPVSVWHGRLDKMAPFAHGQWLAANVAGARAHLYDDEGHVSLAAQLDRIVADLADSAGLT